MFDVILFLVYVDFYVDFDDNDVVMWMEMTMRKFTLSVELSSTRDSPKDAPLIRLLLLPRREG